jgi:hypothetical protein
MKVIESIELRGASAPCAGCGRTIFPGNYVVPVEGVGVRHPYCKVHLAPQRTAPARSIVQQIFDDRAAQAGVQGGGWVGDE